MFRFVFSLFSAAFGLFVVAAALGAVLVVTGDPEACVDRTVPVSAAEAQSLDDAWRSFRANAARADASLVATETQVTSRGVAYIEEKDVPVEDLQVYFCPDGTAEAKGKISAIGLTAKVVVRGTLDLSGSKPSIHVDEIQAGNLPTGVATALVNAVIDRSDFKSLDLDVNLRSITFSDGTAELRGGP